MSNMDEVTLSETAECIMGDAYQYLQGGEDAAAEPNPAALLQAAATIIAGQAIAKAISEGLERVARSIDGLAGDTSMPHPTGIESFGMHLGEKLGDIATSLGDVASAISEHT